MRHRQNSTQTDREGESERGVGCDLNKQLKKVLRKKGNEAPQETGRE